ncbi:hypothetical protein DPMN_129349 [Dreissena polymorpha]|uniref:G-protein coupled receptors family 1 profile domain-containing protein n=2 Tax=Dreissena polymorpha TaxID=45954 RepID=A0A9D4H2Z6_DREPO|nr:hypothetical protein DPMN_129349 [Dreissena polymorpha]
MTITQNASSVDNSSALTKSSQWDTHGYVCVTIVAMFVPFILLGNLMVIISVAKFKRLHIPTNYFLTSLAVADVLVAAALPFYALAELHHLDMGDSSLCIVVNRVLMTAGGVSVMTLAVNACDRYTAIMNPLEYILIMKPRRIAVLVLICWIFSSFICWAPFVIGWYTSVPGEKEHNYNQLHKNARILFTGAIFVPSCILIVFFYWRMFLIARHHAHAFAAVEQTVRRSLEARFVRKDTKYAKTIGVLIGVFLCCWLRFQICIVVDITHQVSSHRW